MHGWHFFDVQCCIRLQSVLEMVCVNNAPPIFTMKRPILLAAVLAIAPLLPATAFAQTAPASTSVSESGSTQRMFAVNSVEAGQLTFSGAGTATFNNSIGSNNQFVVGSSTNLGVSASLSSTPEFDAVAKANLMLTGDSSLMQTNGTASQAANAQAASSAAASSALQTSLEVADSKFGSSFSEFQTKTSGTSGCGWWCGYSNNQSITTSAQYEEAKENFRSEKYSEAYTSAISTTESSSSGSSQSGVISGSFVSSSNSASSVAQTISQSSVYTQAASAASSAADDRFGSTFASRSNSVQGQTFTDEQSWSAAKSDYMSMLAKSFSDSGLQAAESGLTSQDTSNVTVTGLGAIASVNAKDSSTFLVDLSRLTTVTQATSTATANGSANSNLSTNSFASSSRAETASAFMQAFAATTDTSF